VGIYSKTVYAFCTNRYASFIHVFLIIATTTTTTTTTNYYDYKSTSIGLFHCTMKIIVIITIVVKDLLTSERLCEECVHSLLFLLAVIVFV